MMAVENPHRTTIEPPLATAEAGVIEEARARQRRHRRIGMLLLLAVALTGLIAAFGSGGGGGGRGRALVAHNGKALPSTLRLPRGHTTTTFTIRAPADHAYDVTMTGPAASAIVLTMDIPAVANDRVISPAAGWTVNTLSDSTCHTNAGHTGCLLHFSAGGNPGGTWTGVVHKTSIPAARVQINIVFAPRAGDFPG